jgi:hypothetical protein
LLKTYKLLNPRLLLLATTMMMGDGGDAGEWGVMVAVDQCV